jgi:hypothetical protein
MLASKQSFDSVTVLDKGISDGSRRTSNIVTPSIVPL